MASLLVIGGTGFFGKSILDCFHRGRLETRGITGVHILARNALKLRDKAPELISERVHLLQGDLSQIERLPNVEYIINAATSTDVRRYLENPEREYNNSVEGMDNFIRRVEEYCPSAKVLYISSGAVYKLEENLEGQLVENGPLRATNRFGSPKEVYASGKIYAEGKIKELARRGLKVSIARCFAFYGKYLPHDWHFAIGNFIAEAKVKGTVTVSSDKRVIRSYLHADDLVDWLLAILFSSSGECPIFNVGSDSEMEIRDLAGEVARQYDAKPVYVHATPIGCDRYVPCVNKIKTELGVEQTIDIVRMIEMSKSH